MKTLKYFLIAIFAVFSWSCSEDAMDEVNKNVNDASSATAFMILPDAILKTAITANATDLAWYSSMFIEHSAGQWAQHHDADRRLGLISTSTFNNHWNGMYDILNMLKLVKEMCAPGGPEENNKHALGIAQILTAYNLAVLTDFWGEVPWTEAIAGAANMKPKFDRQSFIYSDEVLFKLIDDGIANLDLAIAQGAAGPNAGIFDYLYGGNNARWKMFANSLKARLHMRLTQRDTNAPAEALAAAALGFAGAADAAMFTRFTVGPTKQNPWFTFRTERTHLAASSTLINLMNDRDDPRMDIYFTLVGGAIVGAPPGAADRVQGGRYSESRITAEGQLRATPLMTFHELKFIEAEAMQRAGRPVADVRAALQAAIRANFVFHGSTAVEADEYFTDDVAIRFTANPLNEILVQKYIAMYEFEASEAYHDYRRTGVPTLLNPNNALIGFPHRLQYGNSEESNNPDNFITVDIFENRVWWAGGTELVD